MCAGSGSDYNWGTCVAITAGYHMWVTAPGARSGANANVGVVRGSRNVIFGSFSSGPAS